MNLGSIKAETPFTFGRRAVPLYDIYTTTRQGVRRYRVVPTKVAIPMTATRVAIGVSRDYAAIFKR